MARVIATVWPGAAPAIAKIVERPRPMAFFSSVGAPGDPATPAAGGLAGSVGALIAVLLYCLVDPGFLGSRPCTLASQALVATSTIWAVSIEASPGRRVSGVM